MLSALTTSLVRRAAATGLALLTPALSGCGAHRLADQPAAAANVPAAPRRDGIMRIGLRRHSGAPSLTVRLSAPGWLRDAAGAKLRRLAAHRPLTLSADYASGRVRLAGPGVDVAGQELALDGGLVRIGSHRFPGTLRVRLAGTGLQLVNEVEIEDYLRGVLPGEIPAGFGMEAQKALAVAARSYALVQRGKHGEFDLCDGTCCQMYLGYSPGARRGIAAVRATRHQCLWSERELAYAFYSAHCGGVSTRVEDVPLRDKPDRPLPYLRLVRDAPAGGRGYCAHSRYRRWVKRLERDELERRLNDEPVTYVGRLVDVRFTQFDASRRVLSVLLKGMPAAPPTLLGTAALTPAPTETTVSGWQFRNAVGALTLKSTRVTVGQTGPNTFRFIGSGFGHGLGLCQIGADGMAQRGRSYRQILAHYYPGTRIAPLAQ